MAYTALIEESLEEMAISIPPLHTQETGDGSEYLIAYEHLRGGGWDWYLVEYDPKEKVALGLAYDGEKGRIAYMALLDMAHANEGKGSECKICMERPWHPRALGLVEDWRSAKGSWDGRVRFKEWLYEHRAKMARIDSDRDLIALYRANDAARRRDLGELGGADAPLSLDGYADPVMFDLEAGGTKPGADVCASLNLFLASKGMGRMELGDVAVVKRGHDLHGYYCDTVGHKDVTRSLFAERWKAMPDKR